MIKEKIAKSCTIEECTEDLCAKKKTGKHTEATEDKKTMSPPVSQTPQVSPVMAASDAQAQKFPPLTSITTASGSSL
jgi:hypothetical protein